MRTGRNPHVHVFMHCPPRQCDELNSALVANYSAGVIDVSEGGDIRKPHPSGYRRGADQRKTNKKQPPVAIPDRSRTPAPMEPARR